MLSIGFASFTVGTSEEAFTKHGFRYWKNATGSDGKLSKHAATRTHQLCLERLHNFKSNSNPITVQLDDAHRQNLSQKELERSENRKIFEILFDVVIHLAKQNCSFRGHDECNNSENRGNFLEELTFLSKYCEPLKRWMEKHPGNVSYFPHTPQNEMIDITSKYVVDIICKQIRDAKYFSIEVDEVTSHRQAFMSIVIRYVHDSNIHERCIRLIRVHSLTGKSLSSVILNVLADMNLKLIDMIGMGFDGASNMSGKEEGVQNHLKEAGATYATYFHCFGHKLNLVLEKSALSITSVIGVFSTIGDIYSFMEGSPKRHGVYEKFLKEKGINTGKTALHSFSDTRWSARSDNLEVILNAYSAIVSVMEHFTNEGDCTAKGLLIRLTSFSFFFSCVVLRHCFRKASFVSAYLQKENMDLSTAVSAINDLKKELSSLRNENGFDQFIGEAMETVKQINYNDLNKSAEQIENQSARKRQKRLPSRFSNDTVIGMEGIQHERPSEESEKQLLKREFYFSFLDRILLELDKRFSVESCEIMNLASVFHPENLSHENENKIERISKLYNLNVVQIKMQYSLFVNSEVCDTWKKSYRENLVSKKGIWLSLPSLLSAFKENHYDAVYCDLYNLIKLVGTLPMSVASCERIHSKAKLLNTYLRAAMSPERLEDLVIISAERDITSKIGLQELVEKFKLSSNRRLPL